MLALFVALGGTAVAANTIRSTDIVDGQVMTADLAPSAVNAAKLAGNAVTSPKVKDNALTGADIDESTLGRVPDSSRLGGVGAAEFRPGTAMATQRTDSCAQTGIWKLCAPVTVTVPGGTSYKVDVHTSMTAFGSTAGQGLFCAASEGPACLNAHPSGFSLAPGQYMNVSHTGTAYFGPGTHTFGMAARYDTPIAPSPRSPLPA